MGELFHYLVESGASEANMFRAFQEDERRRRTFVFNLEYYTIIGDDCKPMDWQYSDQDRNPSEGHIHLTRCSAVVALSLSGVPIGKVRNPARCAKTRHGFIFDPFASWQVLNIQYYPDWKASTDTHNSSKHYVNGQRHFFILFCRSIATHKSDSKRFTIGSRNW